MSRIILYDDVILQIYSASMKSYQYPNLIQLTGYFTIHVSGQRQTGLEKNTSSTSPGNMVHVMHVLFVVFAVLENLKVFFRSIHTSTYPKQFH